MLDVDGAFARDSDVGQLVVLDHDILSLPTAQPLTCSSLSTGSPVTESSICRLRRLPVARLRVRDQLLLIGIEWNLDRDTLDRHPTPACTA
jgi:hypothetical protein